MTAEVITYKMQTYVRGETAFVGFQPPLPDASLDALDDILIPEGKIANNTWVEKEQPDVGGHYTVIDWELKSDDVVNKDRPIEVVAAEIANVLRDNGLEIDVEEEVKKIPESGYMFDGRRFTREEYMLNEYGLSPVVARLWLKSAYDGITPEEIRQANPIRHGTHELEAFVRIALGDKPRYMLFDVYEKLHAEIEKEENMSGGGISKNRFLLELSKDSFLDKSKRLTERFAPVAELVELGINKAEFDSIQNTIKEVNAARQNISHISSCQQAIGLTSKRKLIIVDEIGSYGTGMRPKGYEDVSFIVRSIDLSESEQSINEERLTRESVHQQLTFEPVTLNTTMGDIVIPPLSSRGKTTVAGKPIIEITSDSHLAVRTINKSSLIF